MAPDPHLVVPDDKSQSQEPPPNRARENCMMLGLTFICCSIFIIIIGLPIVLSIPPQTCQQKAASGNVVFSSGYHMGNFNYSYCSSLSSQYCPQNVQARPLISTFGYSIPAYILTGSNPLIAPDGTVIASSMQDFISSRFDLTCGGVLTANEQWWSGSGPFGQGEGAYCCWSWTTNNNTILGEIGSTTSISVAQEPCNQTYVVLCICA